MDHSRIMDPLERMGNGQHQAEDLLRVERAVLFYVRSQILSLEILHDDVRRTIRLKVFPDTDDTGFTEELGDLTRLFQKVIA